MKLVGEQNERVGDAFCNGLSSKARHRCHFPVQVREKFPPTTGLPYAIPGDSLKYAKFNFNRQMNAIDPKAC
eukprot:scaffold164_cov340-Pinguiococcus_pyrenoidosus.AAC.9